MNCPIECTCVYRDQCHHKDVPENCALVRDTLRNREDTEDHKEPVEELSQ